MSAVACAKFSHVAKREVGFQKPGRTRVLRHSGHASCRTGGWCGRAERFACGGSRRAVVSRATATETLAGEELAAWEESVELLQSLGFDADGANVILERSFGWGKPSQGFWRGEVVEVVPSVEQIQLVVDYLGELGIKGQDLNFYVNKFPNVFGCSVEGLLKANVEELEKTWKIKGATLAATLRRRPEILGYNLDCYGDCKGECNRCWVRF